MTEIIDNEAIDSNTCDEVILDKLFSRKLKLTCDKAVSLRKSYVNKIYGTKSMKFAVSLSDNSIEVYSLNKSSLDKFCKLSGHSNNITDLVFSPLDDNILFSAALDGVVKMWDCRTSGFCVSEFKENKSDSPVKPLESFDISCSGKVLCGGTQMVEDEAFLVFWDIRKTTPLGGYWNSHTDDITQVRFHKDRDDRLVSGSLDGLINVFDIKQHTEDDALLYSMNVENSIEKISWLDDRQVSCVTQSGDVQLWDAETGDQIVAFNRDNIAEGIKRSSAEDLYSVDLFRNAEGKIILLAGSNAGNGDCLRSVEVHGKILTPSTNFKDNKQIVRCCWYDAERDILVTAGESGIISVWESTQESVNGKSTTKVISSLQKLHVHRKKPY